MNPDLASTLLNCNTPRPPVVDALGNAPAAASFAVARSRADSSRTTGAEAPPTPPTPTPAPAPLAAGTPADIPPFGPIRSCDDLTTVAASASESQSPSSTMSSPCGTDTRSVEYTPGPGSVTCATDFGGFP